MKVEDKGKAGKRGRSVQPAPAAKPAAEAEAEAEAEEEEEELLPTRRGGRSASQPPPPKKGKEAAPPPPAKRAKVAAAAAAAAATAAAPARSRGTPTPPPAPKPTKSSAGGGSSSSSSSAAAAAAAAPPTSPFASEVLSLTLCLSKVEERDAERIRSQARTFKSTHFLFSDTVTPGCILITPELSRTIKCCTALCIARCCVTPRWFEESYRAGVLLLSSAESYSPPFVRELAERGFRGERSMECRRRGLGVKALAHPFPALALLQGHAVHLPQGMGSRGDLVAMVERLGGEVVGGGVEGLGGGRKKGAGGGEGGRTLVALVGPEGAVSAKEVRRLAGLGVAVLRHHWLTDTALAQEVQGVGGLYAYAGV